MKKMELPKIMNGEKVILALVMDKANMQERILIGAELNVRLQLEGKRDTEVLFDQKRPLGSLILDHDNQNRGWWCAEVFFRLRDALLHPEERKRQEKAGLHNLSGMLESENAVSVFVAARTLSYYRTGKNSRSNTQSSEILERKMLILSRSFGEQVIKKDELTLDKLMGEMGALLHYTMLRHETDLRIWYPWKNCSQECAVVEDSLLPLMQYYLRRLLDWGLCFRVCAVCGKIFVADSGHYSLCSPVCEKVQNRLHKRAFDQRHKDDRPEHLYQQTRDGIKKMLNNYKLRKDTTMEQADCAEREYKAFRTDAKYMKNRVSNDEEGRAFVNWLYTQEKIFATKYGGTTK